MRVLVTGASGSYGRAVATGLVARGDEVVTFQRRPAAIDGVSERLGDLADATAVARAVDGCEGVIHLAARVGIVGSWTDFHAPNVTGTDLLLAAARAAGVSRFVQVSSPSVAHAGEALIGVGATPADPDGTRGHYARSKALAERHALAADAPGFAVIAIRPHLVWGPGDQQLIGRIVARARAGRLALIDDGAALIDTTYLDNAVDALVAALDRADADEVRGRAFVVSNGQPRTVAELLSRICRAAGLPAPHRHVPLPVAYAGGSVAEKVWARLQRTDDPPMTAFLAEQLATAHWFDQREVRRALRWRPRVGLEEGFDRLSAWFAAQPASPRS